MPLNIRKIRYVWSFLGVVFLYLHCPAQTTDEIIRKYYTHAGGPIAWKEIFSMRMTGRATIQGAEYPITIVTRRPNLRKMELSIQGKIVAEGFNGVYAWGLNPFLPDPTPYKKTPAESAEIARQMFEDDLISYAEKGFKLLFLGEEIVDSIKTYKIKLIRNEKEELTYYLDAVKCLPLKLRSLSTEGPFSGQMSEILLSDYRKVQNFMFPFSIIQKIDGETLFQMKMDKIELNVASDKLMFEIPEK